MDPVRFGRALGMGARGAAKALVMAADAATSSAKPERTVARQPAAMVQPGQRLGETASRAASKARATQAGLTRGGRRFGEAAWVPFARLSGVLWLETTGVFFGLFLLTAVVSAWKLRGSWHASETNHTEHQQLLWSIGVAAVFGYFFVSSFVRAARRERRR